MEDSVGLGGNAQPVPDGEPAPDPVWFKVDHTERLGCTVSAALSGGSGSVSFVGIGYGIEMRATGLTVGSVLTASVTLVSPLAQQRSGSYLPKLDFFDFPVGVRAEPIGDTAYGWDTTLGGDQNYLHFGPDGSVTAAPRPGETTTQLTARLHCPTPGPSQPATRWTSFGIRFVVTSSSLPVLAMPLDQVFAGFYSCVG